MKATALIEDETNTPRLFSRKRAELTRLTRLRTSASRTLSRTRARCVASLRWRTGLSSFGSARPRRASICASSRSDLVWLCEIARSFRALATITGCSSEVASREIHGLCVPVSITIIASG